MANTFKHKELGKRKRLGEKTFLTEKMMDRKCGSVDDKVDLLKAREKAEEEIVKEAKEVPFWTFDDLKNEVMEMVKECPKEWRKGQAVFNIIDENFDFAREIQFVDGIDCFFDDEMIDAFLLAVWKRIGPTVEDYEKHKKETGEEETDEEN